jgi:hypothetical protein
MTQKVESGECAPDFSDQFLNFSQRSFMICTFSKCILPSKLDKTNSGQRHSFKSKHPPRFGLPSLSPSQNQNHRQTHSRCDTDNQQGVQFGSLAVQGFPLADHVAAQRFEDPRFFGTLFCREARGDVLQVGFDHADFS